MAFEMKDVSMAYSKKGEPISVFNVVREDPTVGSEYYFYQNDEGAYIAQRITTSGTLRIYAYYGSRQAANLATDFTNRESLTYVEYYLLFPQGAGT